MPRLWPALVGACALAVGALLLRSALNHDAQSRQDRQLAIESARARAEADREAQKVVKDYERRAAATKLETARAALAKARAAGERARTLLQSAPGDPALVPKLDEAYGAYTQYLTVVAGDADVLVERAGIHELRRNDDLALKDLDLAVRLNPALEPAVRERLARLRGPRR
jgi:hypothetical protein